MNDDGSGELLGYFYLDLHPREGKFTHAAVAPLQPGCKKLDGSMQVCDDRSVVDFSKVYQPDFASYVPNSPDWVIFEKSC